MIDWISIHIPVWLFITLIVHGVTLGTIAYLILLERKVASWAQDRIGPNRVGLGFGIIPWLKDKKMFGLGQPLADGLKFIFKEDYRPKNVDKVLFTLAPTIMIIVVIISIAVVPWGGIHQKQIFVDVTGRANPELIARNSSALSGANVVDVKIDQRIEHKDGWGNVLEPARTLAVVTYRYNFQIANLNIGVLFVLATLSLAVYGVVIGGWASNNKYSFLGALRATANMISYEIPLSLAVLSIVVLYGTLDLGVIVEKQSHTIFGFLPAWNVFTQPFAFVMFLICIHAEANRAPFDLAECEQELVGGYHTEYSAMRFALFFLAEYAGMITTSAVCVALFFGGWHLPGLNDHVDPNNNAVTSSMVLCIIRAVVFFAKTLVIVFVFMWTRWSLPRFRFDQLMQLAWRGLIPVSLAMVMVTAVVVYAFDGVSVDSMTGPMAVALLGANVAMIVAAMLIGAILPKAPPTNRRLRIEGSRFDKTPLPATSTN